MSNSKMLHKQYNSNDRSRPHLPQIYRSIQASPGDFENKGLNMRHQ